MKMQKIFALLLSVLLLLSLAGCGKESVGDAYLPQGTMAGNSAGDYIAKEEGSVDGQAASQLPENRKLIQTVHMNVETEDLDAVLQQIDSRIAQLGGYTESSYIQNGSAYGGRRYRNATLTVRIPAKELEAFVDRVGEISNIVSSRKTVEDITLSYVATESRMKALQTEEARLLELLAKAENMNDLLTIEKRLTEVRTSLEQVTSMLKVYDNQVDYATIHLSIEEVKEYTEVTEPETLWQRIGSGFVKSLKGVGNFFTELFVFLVVGSPYLVLIAAVVVGIVFLHRFRKRRKKQQREQDRAARKAADGHNDPDA